MATIMKLTFGAALLLSAVACNTDPVRVDRDFGNSTRNLLDAQMADPNAAHNPSPGLPGALDGGKGEKAIEAYRSASPRASGSYSSGGSEQSGGQSTGTGM